MRYKERFSQHACVLSHQCSVINQGFQQAHDDEHIDVKLGCEHTWTLLCELRPLEHAAI